jgi:hypothetical protein
MRFDSAGLLRGEDFDSTEAGTEQASEDAEEGGFAGAVFSDENVTATVLEVCRDLAERGEGAE